MSARLVSLLALFFVLGIGVWFFFVREPEPARFAFDAHRPFRFLEWVQEHDFDAAGAGRVADVDRVVFDSPAALERIVRMEDIRSATVEDGVLRIESSGNRARLYLSVDRPAVEANTLFVRMRGAGTGDRPRTGWGGEAYGVRVTSRGAMPLVRIEHEPHTYMIALDDYAGWQGRIAELYVQFGVTPGEVVEVESVSLSRVPLSAQWLELDRKETLTGRVTIDGDRRESVLVAPPARIDTILTPEQGAVLEFGYAVLTPAWRYRSDAVRFRVIATEDGVEEELFDEVLDPGRVVEDRRWFFARVELSAYVDREIALSLVTSRDPRDDSIDSDREIPAVFASPTVHTPRRLADPPNVLLVSLDTLRADRISSQGHPSATSPYLDRFARSGLQFRAAVSHAASTGPSHMSLFTSLYPTVHGVTGQSSRLSESVVTMAEIFSDAGYATEALTNGGYIRGQLGFDQGFDTYLDRKYNVDLGMGRIDEMVDRAIDSLTRYRDRPFLLFLHSYEIHAPYCPIEPYADMFVPDYAGPLNNCIDADMIDRLNHGFVRGGPLTDENYNADPPTAQDVEHVRRLYDAGIRQTDRAVGRLLDALETLDLAENTVVVFFSDHGEDLGDHLDIGRHAHSLYEEIVHVPLLMRWPSVVSRPRVIEAPTALMDVLPTFVEILGLPTEAEFQGASFAAMLRGSGRDSTRDDVPIYSENFRHGSAIRLSLRRGDDKMIHTRTDEVFGLQNIDYDSPRMEGMRPGVELFDLERDAAERRNLSTVETQRRDGMKAKIDDLFREQRERAVDSVRVELTPGLVKRLQNLGYLRDDDPSVDTPDAEDDDSNGDAKSSETESGNGKSNAADPIEKKRSDDGSESP